MSNSQDQLQLGMDLSPAEWLNQCRRTIAKARAKGFETSHIERAQKRVFDSQKQKFMQGRA